MKKLIFQRRRTSAARQSIKAPTAKTGVLFRRQICLILLLALIPFASAIQFSPTSLEFSLEKNQISCKKINFQIESPTTLKDTWAKSPSEDWSIINFKTTAQENSLELSYPSEISPEEKEIEVCLSGASPGEYKGALVFRENEIGNSIVQFAIWLKVNIEGEIEQEETRPSSSKSSGGGKSSGIIWRSEQPNQQKYIQPISFTPPQKEIKLNSPQTKQTPAPINKIVLTVLPIILLATLIFLLIRI